VLCPDGRALESPCLVDCQRDHLLCLRREADLIRLGGGLALTDHRLDGSAGLYKRCAEISENLPGDTFVVVEDAKHEMLRADVLVVKALRFMLGDTQRLLSAIGELLKTIGHRIPPPTTSLNLSSMSRR